MTLLQIGVSLGLAISGGRLAMELFAAMCGFDLLTEDLEPDDFR